MNKIFLTLGFLVSVASVQVAQASCKQKHDAVADASASATLVSDLEKCTLEEKDERGYTPLLAAIIDNKPFAEIKRLCEAGADVNSCIYGRNPFSLAFEAYATSVRGGFRPSEKRDILEYLAKAGSDINKVSDAGSTLLDRLVQESVIDPCSPFGPCSCGCAQRKKRATELLEYIFSINCGGQSFQKSILESCVARHPLFLAAAYDNVDVAELLLENGGAPAIHKGGEESPFVIALKSSPKFLGERSSDLLELFLKYQMPEDRELMKQTVTRYSYKIHPVKLQLCQQAQARYAQADAAAVSK